VSLPAITAPAFYSCFCTGVFGVNPESAARVCEVLFNAIRQRLPGTTMMRKWLRCLVFLKGVSPSSQQMPHARDESLIERAIVRPSGEYFVTVP
jgi:hypothetical protein